MAAGCGPSTTPRPRSPPTSTASSRASAPATRSPSARCPRCRASPTHAPEVSCELSDLEPRRSAGPTAAVRPLAADPARRPPAQLERLGSGGVPAVLVLAALPRRLAGRPAVDPGAEALALAPLRPRRPRLHRLRAHGDRSGRCAAAALLRAPALLAVRRVDARLRPARHQALGRPPRARHRADP